MKAFLSCSRKDLEFTEALRRALAERGEDFWRDVEGIPLTAEWWREITEAIEKSDNFIFVISPDSVGSDVCAREIGQAVSNNKRLVSIHWRETDLNQLDPALARLNWIDFLHGDFSQTVEALIEALNMDIEAVKVHARLLSRALEWNRSDANHSWLLRGDDLKQAEQWLLRDTTITPVPTTLQRTYISSSRRAETRRLQRLVVSTSGALVVSITLAVLAFVAWQRSERSLISSSATSSHVLSEAKQGLPALMEALRAARRLDRLSWMARDDRLRHDVLLALQEAVVGVREFNRLKGHASAVRSIEFSPDGRTLVSGGDDGTVKVWALDGVEVRTIRGHRGPVHHATVSPDGRLLASAGADQTVRLWHSDGRVHRLHRHHQGAVNRVVFSPDGELLASAGADHTIRVSRPDGLLLATLNGHRGAVMAVAFSPDGQRLVSAGADATIRMWSCDGTLLDTFSDFTMGVQSVAFSPGGRRLVASGLDGRLMLLNLAGDVEMTLEKGDVVNRAVFTPDEQNLVTAGGDTIINILNLNGSARQAFRGHGDGVLDVNVAPDGSMIASAGSDGSIRLWRLESDFVQALRTGGEAVWSVTFRPDGTLIAAATAEGNVFLWGRDGQGLRVLSGHQGVVHGINFSHDSQLLATAGWDGTIRLWSREGELKTTLSGLHSGRVYDAAFSPDGRILPPPAWMGPC